MEHSNGLSVDNIKIGTSSEEQKEVIEEIKRRYDLQETIGEGTCSVVKRAIDNRTKAEVAVKIIDKDKVTAVHQEGLRREVEILTQVSHPNIITLMGMYDTGKQIYLVMELATGGQLFDRVIEKGSYTEADAQTLVRNITKAVAYLHEKNIIHRDLKPENLLVKSKEDDTSVKIADFGLSRIFDREQMLLTACGTPAYVAPEVLLAQGYDTKVDCWAIGVITYILLCGFPPFTEKKLPRLLDKIINAAFEYPDEYWDGVSPEAKDFINKLLVPEPTNRMTAAQALGHPWLTDVVNGSELSFVHDNLSHTIQDYNEAKQSQSAD
jgi:serine/threonine protein kinase